jgi:enoyl-CoA hydratase/carnithine racemase
VITLQAVQARNLSVIFRREKIIRQELLGDPIFAVRLTKRLLWKAQNDCLGTVWEISAAMQALAHAAVDHGEAVAAMIEKRDSAFQGQ